MSLKADSLEKNGQLEAHLENTDVHQFHAGDEAWKVLAANVGAAPISEEEESALLKRIDRHLLPILCVTYGLQYIDKAALSIGALFGLLKDLNLVRVVSLNPTVTDTGRYSNVAMIFYIGFIAGSFPLAAIAQRFPTGKVCALYTLTWGIVMIVTPACTSYSGLMAQRFMLGFIESGISPAFVLVIGSWYRKREQVLRTTLFYSCTGLSIVPFLLITYGLVEIGDIAHAWKVIYYFWGGVTILWSAVILFLMPDSPVNATFMSDRERYVSIERLRDNQAGVESKRFDPKQAMTIFADPKMYLLAIMMFCASTPNGAASTFTTLVIRDVYGADARRTLLLTIPTGVVSFVCTFGGGIMAYKVPNARVGVFCTVSGISLLACILQWKLPLSSREGLLAALYLIAAFAGAVGQVLGFIVSNIAGHSKKTAASSVLFIFYCLGNVAGPLFFKKNEAPRYPSGFQATMVCLIIGISAGICYGILCFRDNVARNKLPRSEVDQAFEGLTDRENMAFRYSL